MKDESITFRDHQPETGKPLLEVRDYRPAQRAANGGKGRKFYLDKRLFRPATIPKRGYYVRKDTGEVVVWDWSEKPDRFFLDGTLTAEQAEADMAAKAQEPKPVRQLQSPLVTFTPEQQAEREQKLTEAKARRELQQRNWTVDVFVLAGFDEAAVEAAIAEIGMPQGCNDKKAWWVSAMCKRLAIEIEVQAKLRAVLCGRG